MKMALPLSDINYTITPTKQGEPKIARTAPDLSLSPELQTMDGLHLYRKRK
jgi:hypothetical protein